MNLTDTVLDYRDPIAAMLGAIVSIVFLLFLIQGSKVIFIEEISYGYLFVYLFNIGYVNTKRAFGGYKSELKRNK